ncbi:DUF192 domain-containing protein [Candidatus Woesearchaeota archaeon]|nr:DUF192 domain-containing protein [Candidatus Woesearchaeota archaeon]
MRRIYILIAILIFIILIISLVLIYKNPESKVCISNNCFRVEIADNPVERAGGLMFRKELEENSGMLFIFDSSGEHSFWMKNTLIPLDIIWIDENKEIVYIYENAQPCNQVCNSVTPNKEAKYVLEINSGLVEKYNFKTGEGVRINF